MLPSPCASRSTKDTHDNLPGPAPVTAPPTGVATAMSAIYTCRASATDKAVLLAIMHSGDWKDLAAPREAANDYLATKTGLARSTVITSVKRLVDGGAVTTKRRFGAPPMRAIVWSALEAYESADGHVGGPRTKKVIPSDGVEPVDNPVDNAGKPALRPVAGQMALTGSRSTQDRWPVDKRPVAGLRKTGSRSQSTSSPDVLPHLSTVEGENARDSGAAENLGGDGSPPARGVTVGPKGFDVASSPPWLLTAAAAHQRSPRQIVSMLVTVARHLHDNDGLQLADVLTDGPTLLNFWITRGSPDTLAFSVEASLVADAFHGCSDPLFARYVRSEHDAQYPDRRSSVKELCRSDAWLNRVRVARLWDQAGRPAIFNSSRSAGVDLRRKTVTDKGSS